MRKSFRKTKKNNRRPGIKQIGSLNVLKSDNQQSLIKDSKNKLNPEILNNLKRIEEVEGNIGRNKMFYKGYWKTFYYTGDKTMHALGGDIKNHDIMMYKTNDEQNKLAQNIEKFKCYTKPRNSNMIKRKAGVINNATALLTEREMGYNEFKIEIFPLAIRPLAVELQKPISSEYSSDHYEYNLPEEKTSRRGFKLLTPKQMLQRCHLHDITFTSTSR